MTEEYVALIQAIEEAGHFVTCDSDALDDRIVCASHYYPRGHPRAGTLHGNSFWAAKRGSAWFVAGWAPAIYRVSDGGRVAELCLELLRREPAGVYGDFGEATRRDFGLTRVSDEDFDRAPNP